MWQDQKNTSYELRRTPCFAHISRYEHPVGFYKRGCQVKTLLLSREEGMFFGHPAQFAAPRTLCGARLASPNASDICGIMFLAFFRAASLRH